MDKMLKGLAFTISVVFGATIIFWPRIIFFSAFLFDKPGSDNNPMVWAMAITLWTYPITCLVGIGLMIWAWVDKAPGWKVLANSFIPGVSYVLFYMFSLAV